MQTSYSQYMDPAIAGTLYDLSPRTIDSKAAEAAIGLGFGLIAGTDPEKQVIVPTATFSTGFVGVALLQAKEQDTNGNIVYAAKDTVPVLRKGRAWVPFAAGAAVTAETAAYLVFSGTDAGKWTNAAGAAAVAGARTYTVTTNFAADDTLVVGGVTYTAKSSGATGDQFNIGATIAETVTNIKTVLAADTDITGTWNVTNSGATFTLTEKVPGGGDTPAAATTTGTGVVTSGAATTSTAVDAVAVTGAKFITSNTSTTGGLVAIELS